MKTYLGDSVYCQILPEGDIMLTTENGKWNDPSNLIVLEPEVYNNLQNFVIKQLQAQNDALQKNEKHD